MAEKLSRDMCDSDTLWESNISLSFCWSNASFEKQIDAHFEEPKWLISYVRPFSPRVEKEVTWLKDSKELASHYRLVKCISFIRNDQKKSVK